MSPSSRKGRRAGVRQPYRPRGAGHEAWKKRLQLILAGVLVVGGGLFLLVFFSPVFAARNVAVTGIPEEQQSAVRQAAQPAIESRVGSVVLESLAAVDTAKIRAVVLQQVPSAAEVSVRKKWPRTVQVEVTPRQTGLVWKSGTLRYLIDQNGLAYTVAGENPAGIAVEDLTNLPVQLGQPVVGAGFIRKLQEIESSLKSAGVTVAGFRVPETTFEVQAVTDQGFYALFDTTRPVGSQASGLVEAIKTGKPKEYADLRVPGRVYVK